MLDLIKKLVDLWVNWGKNAPILPKNSDISNMPIPPPIASPSPEKPINTPIVEPSHAFGDYPEEGKQVLRLMVCQKCLLAGMAYDKMVDMFATISGESGWNPYAENINKDGTGDYGIAQLNSKWYLTPNNLTPKEAENNPSRCIDIMINSWRAGRMSDWIAYRSGGYRQRIPEVQNYLPAMIQQISKHQ